MKTFICALTLILCAPSFAGSCKLISNVHDGMGCYSISTRLDVADQEACEAFAKATRENRFFHLLEKDDQLLRTRYVFKDRAQKLKVKKAIDFSSRDVCGGLL